MLTFGGQRWFCPGCESGDACAHGRHPQTDLVGSHWALPITSTLCFDIFSPPPGDNDVISQVGRLSSNEMKIAPRSLRMALGASGRSAIICMAVSRLGDRNLTLPERRSLSTSPWDLETEILALRHQLTVLRRKAPKWLA
jgi:hypothetical protein